MLSAAIGKKTLEQRNRCNLQITKSVVCQMHKGSPYKHNKLALVDEHSFPLCWSAHVTIAKF